MNLLSLIKTNKNNYIAIGVKLTRKTDKNIKTLASTPRTSNAKNHKTVSDSEMTAEVTWSRLKYSFIN